jgi:hypothetical protein
MAQKKRGPGSRRQMAENRFCVIAARPWFSGIMRRRAAGKKTNSLATLGGFASFASLASAPYDVKGCDEAFLTDLRRFMRHRRERQADTRRQCAGWLLLDLVRRDWRKCGLTGGRRLYRAQRLYRSREAGEQGGEGATRESGALGQAADLVIGPRDVEDWLARSPEWRRRRATRSLGRQYQAAYRGAPAFWRDVVEGLRVPADYS